MNPRSERYRAIAETLSVHGFGFAVGAAGLDGRFPFRRGLPGHQPGRTYSQPEHVRLALEELGATFVKLGQILSTRPDLLPPEYLAELARLQDDVTPVHGEVVLQTVVDELGDLTAFAEFDPMPLASASIGQVHAATAHGTEVVVKVRRPGVVEAVASDLEIMENLAERATRHWDAAQGHDLVGIAREFADTLRAELDYLREGHNVERFAANFAGDPDVHIPAVFWDTTTSRVLTLERIRGLKIDDLKALDAAGHDRRQLAARAVRVLCAMTFEHGFFHADPHPGNFFVEPDGRLGIIDFGMVGELSDALRNRLGALLIDLVRGDLDRTTDALLALVRSPADVDRAALREHLAPVVGRFGARSLDELSASELFGEILGLVRRDRLRLPRDLALLFKTLVMAEGLGQRLDPDFQIAAVLIPYAERLAVRMVAPRAVSGALADLARTLLDAGTAAPQSLHGLAAVLERGGFDVRLRADELDRLLTGADRLGNRLVVGMIAAALVNGLGRTAAMEENRWDVMRRALLLAAAGAAGALGTHAARNVRRPVNRHRTGARS